VKKGCNALDGRDVVSDLNAVLEVSLVEAGGNTDDGDEELADKHAESAVDEERATTELLDSPEGDRGGNDVDNGEDHRKEEDVGNGTGRLEEGRGVVEDEVLRGWKEMTASARGTEGESVGGKLEKKLTTPVHCCIIWSEVPRIVRRRLDDELKTEPEKHEPV
jgi:hypothetical protein